MKTTAPPSSPKFAACSFEIQAADNAIQIFPAGVFKAEDGRPADVLSGHWLINADIATRVITRAAARKNDMVVDYEHQTLNSAKNGKPAPAAAWIKRPSFEWREGVGLFATQVEWTPKAADMLKNKEYRYVSPVFSYDPVTGAVIDLVNIAITNDPGLDGMESLPTLAAACFQLASSAAPSVEEKNSVNREQLIAHLGLSSDATDEDIQTALTNLKGSADKVKELEEALKKKEPATPPTTTPPATDPTPDPEKFAPVSVVEALKKDVCTLMAANTSRDVESLVNEGLDDGRLLSAQADWARSLGNKDIAALKNYLEKTPPIAALKGQQTKGGRVAVPATVQELSTEALAICKQMNVKPEEYLAVMKEGQQ
jgi:phage I-like protein